MYRATFNQQRVLCRNIEFDRLTSYVLEDFFHGLNKLLKIKIKANIVPILGFYTKDTALEIFQNEYISLFELLHSPDKADLRK
jgi:hypothetical protein